jgi:hypothetical protein
MKKLISINDTDKAVAEFLKAANIHYSVKFVGSVNSGEWKHDKFYYRKALQVFNHAPARAVTSYPTFSMGRNVSTQMS